tara:strand:+ start:359 stop:790 length:432 start_codon:yes stop_codon:yes gene_type:complete
MVAKTPGSPYHAPPGGANRPPVLLFESVGDHPFSPHLLPDPPAAAIEEAAGVLGSSRHGAKPGYFGRQAVIQLPRHRSSHNADCHQSVPKSIYGIMSVPKSIYGITDTTDREPRTLDLLIMPMILFYKIIGSSYGNGNYFKSH